MSSIESEFIETFLRAGPKAQQRLENACKRLEDILGIYNTAENMYIRVCRIREVVEAFMYNMSKQREQEEDQVYTFRVPGFRVI